MLEGNKVDRFKKAEARNNTEIVYFSLESHQFHNYHTRNRAISMVGLTNQDDKVNTKPKFISHKNNLEKIYAILLIILLLIPLLLVFITPGNDKTLLNENESDENPVMIENQDDTITFVARETLKLKKNPNITGTRGYIGTSPPVGDWTITGDAMVWNETIILNGNLTVTETGNLTLTNVTLKMNCSYNGEFHIEVLGGGELNIYDYDWDRSTTDDTSYITTVDTSSKYLFWIQMGAYFEMRNSKMDWCGYEWGNNGDHSGLWINTDNAVIEGNIIRNFYDGIVVYKGNYTRLENNTISDSIKEQVKYTEPNFNTFGVYLSSCRETIVRNNLIFNINGRNGDWTHGWGYGGMGIGIYFTDSDNNIIDKNKLSDIVGGEGASDTGIGNNGYHGGAGRGIYSYKSQYAIIKNNIVTNIIGGNGGDGWDTGGSGGYGVGAYIILSNNNDLDNNTITKCKGGLGGAGGWKAGTNGYGPGIYVLQSSILFISANYVYESQMGIFLIESQNNNLTKNIILNNQGHGIYAYQSSNNNIRDNLIMNNGYYGIRFQFSNGNRVVNTTITNHTRFGLYFCVQASNNEIINCIISDSGWEGVRALEYSYNNRVINSSISNSANYDLILITDSHLTTINTIFDKNKVSFTDSKSSLTVKWYLHAQVTIYNTPVNNAIIRIKDITNVTFDKTFRTDFNGLVKWIEVTEYHQTSLKMSYFSPYELIASIDSYGGNITVWMDRSKLVTVPLKNKNVESMYCINLKEGWNLISIPLILSNSNLQTVLHSIEGKYDAVQCYNASDTKDHWKHYHSSKPSYLNDLTSIDYKKGIWIHINVSEKVYFFVTGKEPATQQTLELYPGWNLVGYPSIVNRPRDNALNNLKFGTDIDVIYYFNSSIKRWKILGSSDTMCKSIGYWFHAKSKMTWILNNSIPRIYNLNKDIHYNTIQEAVNDAFPYDLIEILPGIYHENVNINKSVNIFGKTAESNIIDGNGMVCINISANYLNLNNLVLQNCSFGMYFNNSSEIRLNNILIESSFKNGIFLGNSSCIYILNPAFNNCSSGILMDNSNNIVITNIIMNNNTNGINAYNFSKVLIVNSTIFDQTLFSLTLQNSDITLLNVTLNTDRIQFLDTESNLIVQWYLHVQTKDQINYPISGTTIRLMDNENGTYNETYITNYDGIAGWIIVTERIQNSTGNISFTPHKISATHPTFTFYDVPCEVTINKTTTVVIISVNTVSPTSIFNINRNRYYLTIQEAIDDANPYDIIRLSSGIYSEFININKPLIMLGEDKYSTVINGGGEIYFNISSDDVIISNLNIQNYTYGIYLDSYNGFKIMNTMISNNTYGIYCNNSSPIIDFCKIENNTIGILSFNFSYPMIINTTTQNEILDFSIADSYFTSLNTHFNTTKVIFLDSLSNLTVRWYLHVLVQDVTGWGIPGANVWIVDNDNGTFDKNFTTGPDGYVWYIILTERIQNLSGNVSFNPYWINGSYYDTEYGYGWLTFPDSPRNISINGTLFEIRKETFTSLEAIPEFSHILIPIMAIIASFVVLHKKRKKIENF